MDSAGRPLHIVHTEASCGWGGQEIRILTEAAALIARGHRLSLLAPPESHIYQAAEAQGLTAVAMPLQRKSPAAIGALRRWLRAMRPDVVNTHSSVDAWVTAVARMGLRRPGVPVVRTRHISAPVARRVTTRWLYRYGADHVVTTGEALRVDLMRRLRLPGSQLTSIPTGIDVTRFCRDNTPGRQAMRAAVSIPADAQVLGIAATLRSWKGHDDLLAAFARLAGELPQLHLLIVGDGPRREVIGDWVARSGDLRRRIRLVGQRDDVPDLMAAMDLFVLPSYANEGVPQAILQAMAMNLPVVSTWVGAIDEAVVEGETGRLVAPRQVTALADALRDLLADPPLLQRMGQAGRERVCRQFALPSMADAMEAVFRRLAVRS